MAAAPAERPATALAAWQTATWDLARRLGDQPEALLTAADRADTLSRRFAIAVETLDQVTQDDLDRWFAVLGAALTLRVDSRTLGEAWEADHTRHDRAELTRFLAEVGELSAPELEASFFVDKGELLARLALPGVAPDDRVRLFFCVEGLRQLLAALTPETFEATFLAGAAGEERLLLLVADTPGSLVGPQLAVVGAPDCDDWSGFADRTGPPADAVRNRMRELTSWSGRDRRLTPDTFALTTRTELEVIAAELVRLQNRLVVPFLANRSGGPDEYLFEGERTAAVTLGKENVSIDLYRLYTWIYHDPEAARTKLEIVRRVLAAGLRGETGETFAALVRGCASFQNDAEFQLRLLLDKNLSASFDLRQKIEETIAGYVGQVRASIESLTQDVVDNVYRTAGLLVGVAIAVLLDADRKLWVVWLGGGLYVCYLLFILQFYLTKRGEQFRRQKEAFKQRFDQHDALGFGVLPPALLRQRREQIRKQNRTFEETYRQVRRLYWAFLTVTFLLVGLLTILDLRGPAHDERAAALAGHAERLRAAGCGDLRADLPGWPRPIERVEAATGKQATPDLTAVRTGRAATEVIVEYTACADIGTPAELERLRLLARIAAEQRATLQLLTEPACSGTPGPDRLRQWLATAGLPAPPIWTP